MINEWAVKHNISPIALQELLTLMGVTEEPLAALDNLTTEAGAQQQVRIKASRAGIRLWRNNRGATYDQDRRMIRFGLGNDSDKIDKKIKSSDLIGITPHEITLADVGRRLGIFTSIEMKKPGWKYAGTDREAAQWKWGKLVISLGGIFKFSTGEL
jgi:hypothetical protein